MSNAAEILRAAVQPTYRTSAIKDIGRKYIVTIPIKKATKQYIESNKTLLWDTFVKEEFEPGKRWGKLNITRVSDITFELVTPYRWRNNDRAVKISFTYIFNSKEKNQIARDKAERAAKREQALRAQAAREAHSRIESTLGYIDDCVRDIEDDLKNLQYIPEGLDKCIVKFKRLISLAESLK